MENNLLQMSVIEAVAHPDFKSLNVIRGMDKSMDLWEVTFKSNKYKDGIYYTFDDKPISTMNYKYIIINKENDKI